MKPTILLLAATTSLAILCHAESPTNVTAVPTAAKPAGQTRLGEAGLRRKPEWYASAEARTIADNVVQYQSPQGGWPKNTDLTIRPTAEILAKVVKDGSANTIDNGGTTMPMRFLALMIHATGNPNYQASFARGFDYLLAAQYTNGGWPQFFPLRDHGYYSHITYNDNAMVNVLNLLRDAVGGKGSYEFVDKERRAKASAAMARGVDCILRTQIKQDGKLTAWCAQHDEVTLEPVWARNFEPPSFSGAESVGVVRFLMSVEKPAPEIVAAVEGAVTWLKSVKVSGLKYERTVAADGKRDGWVVKDENAGPLWARFYELGSNRPIFLGRDKVVHYALDEIERERRAGYVYYGDWTDMLIERDYPRWRTEHKLP